MKRWFSISAFVAAGTISFAALAHEGHDDAAGHEAAAAHEAAPAHDAASEHGAADPHGGHGEGHGHHAAPQFSDINWFTGLVGESKTAEPGLLWRRPGTPVPLGALLINTAILFYLLGSKGGPAIKQALIARKQRVAGDIEAARVMKAQAEEQLAHYEAQLEQMEAEMERIKSEMREQAKVERERILADAAVRREAMERDAHQMIGQELNAARETIAQTTAREAVKEARKLIAQHIQTQDHERLAQDQLASLGKNFSGVRS
ncbi:MAG TPA: ATP synthase F0 subunit B [Polyangiaceae bacterium]|nr:ATP synthase F0 subunit B [Polyangiaceae bacterium]